jgi:hypothetical protein
MVASVPCTPSEGDTDEDYEGGLPRGIRMKIMRKEVEERSRKTHNNSVSVGENFGVE